MYKLVRSAIAVTFLIVSALVSAQQPVNINEADAASIARSLNGVGASRAQAIVQYREENGPFNSVDDLVKVSGIGSKLLDRNRAVIVVDSATVAVPARAQPVAEPQAVEAPAAGSGS